MISLNEALLIGTGAASGVAPYLHNRFSSPAQDLSFSGSRRNELGLSDYLPYEEIVEPDTILTSYGAVGAMYEIVWNDTSTMTERDQIEHCKWLNDAQMKIANLTTDQNGWMAQTYLIPTQAAPLAMPSYVVNDGRRVLAESRNAFLDPKRKTMRDLLALTYLPPKSGQPQVRNLFISGESPIETSYEKVMADFRRVRQGVEDSLGRIGTVRRLETHRADRARNELLETVYQVLYDEQQEIVIGDPFVAQPIGGLLAAYDIVGGMYPKIGKRELRVLSIYGAPARTKPGMLAAFVRSAVPGARFATRIIYQDSEAAKKRLEKARKEWAGQKKTLLQSATPPSAKAAPRVNRTAARREEEVEKAIEVAESARVAYTHFNAKVVMFAEDAETLSDDIRTIRRAIQGEGFTVFEETVNTLEAYFGHVPFDGYHDVREGQVHTANTSRIWSASSTWKGRTSWNCKQCGPTTVPALIGLTRNSEDFAIDPHEEDSQSFLALGFPGCGKTTSLNKLSGEYPRAANDRVFGIDKNCGQLVTTKFFRGDYHEAGQYWLFANLETPSKRLYLANFLANLVKMNGVEIEDTSIFQSRLNLMLDDKPSHRSLSTYLNLLGPADRDGRITRVLGDYAMGGIHGGVFDGTFDPSIGSAQHEVHELGAFLKGNVSEKVSAPVLLWILHSFEEKMPGRRSIVLIDEAWAPIKAPMVANEVEEFLRTTRYRHSGVGFYTHSIAEVKANPIGQTVIGACKTRILYPNPEANGEFRAFYADDLELTPAQIDIVKNGQLKRDANLSANGKFGPYSLPLSPAESAIYGCTGQDEVAAARRLMDEHPDSWDERHLRDYGCHREADRLRSLRRNRIKNCETVREALSV